MAVNIIEGKVINEGMKVGIVCARFNEFITSKLLGGALDAFCACVRLVSARLARKAR